MHLFNPASAPRGLILLAPGGGQDHTSPGIVARATRLTDEGYAVAVVRSLDEVPAVLAEHPGPVGFWGISQGARVGLPLLAAEPRITAAVLGLTDGPVASAPLVTAPVLFYVQSDDDLVQPTPAGRSSMRWARPTRPWSRTPAVTWTCRGPRSRSRLSGWTGSWPSSGLWQGVS